MIQQTYKMPDILCRIKPKQGVIFVGFGKIARLSLGVIPQEVPILGVVDSHTRSIITVPRSRWFESSADVNHFNLPDEMPNSLKYYLDSDNRIIEAFEIPTYHNLKELLSADIPFHNVHYFYICSPTEYHLKHVRQICEAVPNARILIEKPVCRGEEIQEMQRLLEQFPDARIAVNENYASSNLTPKIKGIMAENNMTGNLDIYIEMTKNRIKDIEEGRFLDRTVLGYEIPHMITLTQILLDTPLTEPRVLNVSEIDSFGDMGTYQGSIEMCFETADGAKIKHYSAKDGRIGFTVPEFIEAWNIEKSRIPYSSEYRYRIIRVYKPETEIEIIGQYEPIVEPRPGVKRGLARIIVRKKGKTITDETFIDDTLRQHLVKCRKYFSGKHHNPFPVYEALNIVKLMYEAEKQILFNW